MHPPSGLRRRAAVLCAAALTVLATGCRSGPDEGPVAAATEPLPSTQGADPRTGAQVTGRSQALSVLREWDSRRSAAFAADDERSLSRLYVPGSPLASQDLAVLRGYRERGLRVLHAEQQVVSVEVHETSSQQVTMSVVERLAAGRVEVVPSMGASTRPDRPLPASGFSRRVLRFERTRGEWRLSWASEG